jgi:hypothetical protein
MHSDINQDIRLFRMDWISKRINGVGDEQTHSTQLDPFIASTLPIIIRLVANTELLSSIVKTTASFGRHQYLVRVPTINACYLAVLVATKTIWYWWRRG